MSEFWKDIRWSLRTLLKRPGFSSVCVLTLALGIGANTAIFSVVNAILLRQLPFGHAERIVWSTGADLAIVVLLMASITLLACYIPACRALLAHPMEALRHE